MPYNDDAYVKILQGSTEIATLWASNIETVANPEIAAGKHGNGLLLMQEIILYHTALEMLLDAGLSSVALFDAEQGTTPVPEPSSMIIGAMGVTSVLLNRRRKKLQHRTELTI